MYRAEHGAALIVCCALSGMVGPTAGAVGAGHAAPAPHLIVDEARYAVPAQPSDQPMPVHVSRDAYLALIERYERREIEPRLSWLRQPSQNPSAHANLEAAYHYAFRYRRSGSEKEAKRAVSFLGNAHRLLGRRGEDSAATPDWRAPIRLHHIWRWLTGSPALSDDVRRQMRELMVAAMPRFPERFRDYSPDNRSIGYGLIGQILLHYVPDVPDGGIWKPYIERVWSDFRHFDDTTNNTGNYDALLLRYLIDWVELRGAEKEFYADPDVRRLFERYMLQVLPIGSLPHYGDTTGWNVEWGHWIRIFETAGREFGDGRFRWAAQRIFAYGSTRLEDLFSWSYTGSNAVESLMHAYLVTDDALDAQAPEPDLALLERRGIDRGPGGPVPFVLRADRVPSKLVFRSDSSPRSTAFLVDLAPAASHNDPPVPTNLVALVNNGSVLLMDQGYDERAISDHNVLWLEDYEGFPLHPERQRVQVTQRAEVGPLLHAVARVADHQGYPVSLERHIVFAREGAVLIVDRIRFRDSFEARLGPVFNLGVVGPEAGDSWVNGYLGDSIPVRAIGLGAPVLAHWSNPPRDLLIQFRPSQHAQLHIVDRRSGDPTVTLPFLVQQRVHATPQAGEVITFASVLLPHAPVRHPGALAERVQFAETSDGRSVAVRVPLPDGGDARAVWLSSGPVDSQAFSTDADAAAVVMEGERVVSLGIANGSHVVIGSQLLVDEPTRRNLSR